MTEAKLARLLEVARESYDLIVVDTSPFFHGPMLATLDRTDELLLVCGLDVPTLKNVRLALQTLELLSFPAHRIRFVLNRANSNVGLKQKRGRRGPRCEDQLRAALRSGRAARREPRAPAGARRRRQRVRPRDPRDLEGAARCSATEEEAGVRVPGPGIAMGLHDRLSKQNENGAAGATAERPAALAGPVANDARPKVQSGKGVDPYAELKTGIHHA